MSDTIVYEYRDGIAHITIDRPDTGNRVTNAMAADLGAAIESAGIEGARLVLLRGTGEVFCLGRDLPPDAESGTAIEIRAGNTDPALALFAKFEKCPATIVGVVQGRAVGIGCAMAALCDITLAADDAQFQVPEMGRDLPPTLVMWALSGRIPRKAAAFMVYSRDPLDAQTALGMGLVSRVVPADDLEDATSSLMAKLSENSAAALNAVKVYMRSAPDADRQSAADLASNLLSNVLASGPGST
jgi:enoyl-CoA hydratase